MPAVHFFSSNLHLWKILRTAMASSLVGSARSEVRQYA